ncbi:chromo domain-containing protein [Aspergillus homomorphus CBS 101889]|uniref:Chromo domain-containing protein n=1 Tax=Aspergillus homomorphus (strain CBS 101889) TaxID=1450537 RepID=A0A395HFP1_ASPHC|nr:hypothetical protein BO97DRAFT_409583 [Aspergillus homomorphus CBS 101889]RAL06550.1 hypothetical protein BO97DRAFT_409583 [Aspergillus homomorphus CBS 101889]
MHMKNKYSRDHQPIFSDVSNKVSLRLPKGYNLPLADDVLKKLDINAPAQSASFERGEFLFYRELPKTSRVYPAISVALLEPAPRNNEPQTSVQSVLDVLESAKEDLYADPFGQQPHEPTAIDEVSGEWEVERILNKCIRRHGPGPPYAEYSVCWLGYCLSHDQWICEYNLDSPDLVYEFDNAVY